MCINNNKLEDHNAPGSRSEWSDIIQLEKFKKRWKNPKTYHVAGERCDATSRNLI